MTEYTKLIERLGERYGVPDLSTDQLLNRRDRKRRNQRIAAGVVGIAVFLAAVWIVTNSPFDQAQTPAVPGGAETGPIETGPTETGPTETRPTWTVGPVNGENFAVGGPTYTLGPVTKEDIAVGESFMQAWVDGDGEAAAAMFTPDATFDGFKPTILPALHDWFRAGGWTFGGGGCGLHGWSYKRGVVGCGFTYENDITQTLGMRPVPSGLSFAIEAGTIKTAWFGAGGDAVYNLFGSPDPVRDRPGGEPDPFGPVWDMFIDWLSSRHPEDFDRMYDPDYGYPVDGYPILDPASIKLWERYTNEFVASPQELRRSFTEWMANESLRVQASRICMTATEEFWATVRADNLQRNDAAFYSTLARISEKALAELRELPLETEADRAAMDAFVPHAERLIELERQQAEAAAAGDHKRLNQLGAEWSDLWYSVWPPPWGCLVSGWGY